MLPPRITLVFWLCWFKQLKLDKYRRLRQCDYGINGWKTWTPQAEIIIGWGSPNTRIWMNIVWSFQRLPPQTTCKWKYSLHQTTRHHVSHMWRTFESHVMTVWKSWICQNKGGRSDSLVEVRMKQMCQGSFAHLECFNCLSRKIRKISTLLKFLTGKCWKNSFHHHRHLLYKPR